MRRHNVLLWFLACVLFAWPAAAQDLHFGAGDAKLFSGNGTPNSAVIGDVGDFYSCVGSCSGSYLWVKETGAHTNTGWVAYSSTGSGGTVTSVALTAPSGWTAVGSPITTSGTLSFTGILGSSVGGTGNGFSKFSGPTSSEKTFTLPDASATVLTETNTTAKTPQFARLGLGCSAASTEVGKFCGVYYSPGHDEGNSGTMLAVDLSTSNEHLITLTGNVTLTFSNPTDYGRYVFVIATGAGSFTVAWPAAVLWSGGTAPVITATGSKVDIVTMIYVSGTGKYYAAFTQNY